MPHHWRTYPGSDPGEEAETAEANSDEANTGSGAGGAEARPGEESASSPQHQTCPWTSGGLWCALCRTLEAAPATVKSPDRAAGCRPAPGRLQRRRPRREAAAHRWCLHPLGSRPGQSRQPEEAVTTSAGGGRPSVVACVGDAPGRTPAPPPSRLPSTGCKPRNSCRSRSPSTASTRRGCRDPRVHGSSVCTTFSGGQTN